MAKGIVVMANGDGGKELIDEIVRSAARSYQWPDFSPQRRQTVSLDSSVLDGQVRDYEVREYGFVISVRRDRDHLVVATPRGSSGAFYPATESEYFSMEDGSPLTIANSPTDTQTVLRVWGMIGVRQ